MQVFSGSNYLQYIYSDQSANLAKLAGQSANLRLAMQFANGTTNLKIIFEVFFFFKVLNVYSGISHLASFQTNGFY